jgi:hypothetical protein
MEGPARLVLAGAVVTQVLLGHGANSLGGLRLSLGVTQVMHVATDSRAALYWKRSGRRVVPRESFRIASRRSCRLGLSRPWA